MQIIWIKIIKAEDQSQQFFFLLLGICRCSIYRSYIGFLMGKNKISTNGYMTSNSFEHLDKNYLALLILIKLQTRQLISFFG